MYQQSTLYSVAGQESPFFGGKSMTLRDYTPKCWIWTLPGIQCLGRVDEIIYQLA